MTYAELIKLYYERSNALQWYWTLYVVIVGGLLAFSSLRVQKDLVTATLVTILFCFFAFKNLGAIGDVTKQRLAALKVIQEYPLTDADAPLVKRTRAILEPTLGVPAWIGVRNFHIASDLLTVLAIWAMEWRRWGFAGA